MENEFWSALSAVGTILAVIVAIFLPSFRSVSKKNAVAKALYSEVEKTYEGITNAKQKAEEKNVKNTSPEFYYSIARDGVLKIDTWKAFRFELATLSHTDFIKFSSLYNPLLSAVRAAEVARDYDERLVEGFSEVQKANLTRWKFNTQMKISRDAVTEFIQEYEKHLSDKEKD